MSGETVKCEACGYHLRPNETHLHAAPAPTPEQYRCPVCDKDSRLCGCVYAAAPTEPVTPTMPKLSDEEIAGILARHVLNERYTAKGGVATSVEAVNRIARALARTRADEREKCAAQLRDYAERQADDVVAIRAATWEEAAHHLESLACKYDMPGLIDKHDALIEAAAALRAKGGR